MEISVLSVVVGALGRIEKGYAGKRDVLQEEDGGNEAGVRGGSFILVEDARAS